MNISGLNYPIQNKIVQKTFQSTICRYRGDVTLGMNRPPGGDPAGLQLLGCEESAWSLQRRTLQDGTSVEPSRTQLTGKRGPLFYPERPKCL